MICQEINCPDYLIDDGEPAWCYRAGQPAGVAVLKCQMEADKGKDSPIERNAGSIIALRGGPPGERLCGYYGNEGERQ